MPSTIKFVIFGLGRTGSSLLVDLLNSHPDIYCDGEVLALYRWGPISQRVILPLWRYYPLPLLEYWALRSRRKAAFGLKLLVVHLHRPQQVMASLHGASWRIIHIHRRDLFALTISYEVALRTQRWKQNSPPMGEFVSLQLDPKAFMARLEERVAKTSYLADVLASVPHLEIVYENCLAERAMWPATSERLLTYLGLPMRPLNAGILKTWERPYSEMISNYDELITCVAQSPFAHLLDHSVP